MSTNESMVDGERVREGGEEEDFIYDINPKNCKYMQYMHSHYIGVVR